MTYMQNINKLDGKAKEFAEANYNTQNADQLREALKHGADATDCAEWGITADQWLEAVQAAIDDIDADAECNE